MDTTSSAQADNTVVQKEQGQTTTSQEKPEPKVSSIFACATPQCRKASTLQCPTCVKLELPPTYFCSQECFKDFWGVHKMFHKKSK